MPDMVNAATAARNRPPAKGIQDHTRSFDESPQMSTFTHRCNVMHKNLTGKKLEQQSHVHETIRYARMIPIVCMLTNKPGQSLDVHLPIGTVMANPVTPPAAAYPHASRVFPRAFRMRVSVPGRIRADKVWTQVEFPRHHRSQRRAIRGPCC